MRKSRRADRLLIALFSLLSAAYVYPLFMVVMNSLKKKVFISRAPFALPKGVAFAGLQNYRTGLRLTGFGQAMGCSVVITLLSVGLILLGASMCAWYLARVKGRLCRYLYGLYVLSMAVPFQMVMFTLSKTASVLSLNTPLTIPVIYLGFGAGLAVFIFTGFVRGFPVAVEESAMMDGCSPPRIFFSVVLPILQPSCVSAGILEAMWIWNDYLLPYLVLDLKRFKTIPIAVQYLKGGYGSVDMGAMMAMLVLAIAPIVAAYLFGQRYIVSGVMAGAVKG